MKQIFVVLAILLLFTACKKTIPADKIALKVGDISVTGDEYRKAYHDSPYSVQNTADSRKQFLESYALRLMILQEAEDIGLDRDPEFLKDVEFFWQQALIKRMLEKKIAQYSTLINVSDSDVQRYFIQNQNSYFRGKSFQDSVSSIKSFLTFQQQNKALESWMDSLKGKMKLRVNKALVGLE